MRGYGRVKSLLTLKASELEDNGQDAHMNEFSAPTILSTLLSEYQTGGLEPATQILSYLPMMQTARFHKPEDLIK